MKHYLLVTGLLIMMASSLVQAGELPRKNPVMEKIRAGKPVFGGFVTIPSAKVIENLAVPGKLDFIWIEAEHTEFGPRETQDLAIAAENEGLVPELKSALTRIETAARLAGKPLGCALPDAAKLSEKMAAGNRFFTIPGDMEMLQQSVLRYFPDTPLPSK